MNRSILIVICDFIITSMIYLNGGFSTLESQSPNSRPADQQAMEMLTRELESQRYELEKARQKLLKSKSGANKEELERVTRELAMTRAKLENISRKKALNENNSGIMSKEDMRQELDEEIYQKHLAVQRYELLQLQLQYSREDQKNLQQQSSHAQQEIARLDERLAGQKAQFEQKLDEKERELKKSNDSLQKKEALITEQNRKLQDTSDKLVKTSKDLAVVQKDLEHARSERDKAQKAAARSEQARNEQIKVAQENARSLQRDLKNAEKARENAEKVSAARQAALNHEKARQQQLSRELAKKQDELNKEREALKQAKAQLEKERRNIDTMKRMVADTSQQLSKAKQEQAAAKQGEAAAKQKLKQTQNENIRLQADSAKLKAVEKQLESYRSGFAQQELSYAFAELNLKYQQPRFMGRDREISVHSYLPVFSAGNRNYVVSALPVIGGKQENSSAPKNITKLEYLFGRPRGQAARVTGSIWLASDDCRVALMDVTGLLRDIKPLKLITLNELRLRGSLDLYLLKHNSEHALHTKLGDRSSWGVGNDRYIYVTNSQSRNSNELKAEVGDLLLTRQGELAGVVVAVKNNRARCYVFSKLPTAQQMRRIGQGNAANKFQEFVTGMNLFMEEGEKLTKSQP